ncbi:MAG: BatA and WFA domain-containing protein [Candidatus Promineifilaceae bacterium]
MSFLTPLFLLLSLLAGPIILLYMLRLRRQEMQVSSTLLWQKLLRDREANAPWQRLRRNLLLILQLLILAFLVLALARPFWPVATVVSGNVVLLLDASASMQATDVAPDRFAAAKEEAGHIIRQLGGGDQMTLILVGTTPQVLAAATSDHTLLTQALEQAVVGDAAADWSAAFALAAGAAQGYSNARVVILSDGGLPANLPPLPAELVYLPIGNSGENLALSALATRNSETGIQLFASITNHGLIDRETLLSVRLDGTLFDSRQVQVSAGNTNNLTWELPAGSAIIQATLSDNPDDILPADDTAWAVHEGGISNRVLLVTQGNLFLEQIYAVLPGVSAFKAAPDSPLLNSTEEPSEQFDLYVFDGVPLPNPPPLADLFIINPTQSISQTNDLFTVTGVFSATRVTRLSDNPLLQFVDWSGVDIRQAKQVTADWAQTLIMAEGGSLLLTGERAGQRVAILTFDLRDSDLPLQIAFPILMANLTGWLNPGQAFDTPAGLPPGDPVSITPGASTTHIQVIKPDGTVWTQEVTTPPVIFAQTDQLGLYQVSLRDAVGEQPAGSFAVNLFDPEESAAAPQPTIQLAAQSVGTAPESDVSQRELWPYLAALAFILLVVEWWVHFRGTARPRLSLPQKRKI